jgi:hypothetical protein
MVLLRFFVIIGLVRVLLVSESPLLCAVLYGLARFMLGLASDVPHPTNLGLTSIGFALAWIYFALLQRVESGSLVWWLIALPGLALILV